MPLPNASPETAPKTAAKSGRAADDLFKTFEDMINHGDLREGDTLPPEREIVQQYGVSRTVVREAVLALSNKGLVEAKPRFRPVVKKPSYVSALDTISSAVGRLMKQQDGVRNLFETRITLEAALVRQAAKDAQKGDLADLRAALDANKAAINDSTLFYQTDMAFHAVLYDISRNPIFPAIHLAYTGWLAPQWSQMPRLPSRNRLNYDSHKAIFDAILMRDPDAAETHLRAHMQNAWAQIEKTFGDI